jgi:DNA repair photolyase
MEYISVETKRVLLKPQKNLPFECDYFMSPYHGCELGCVYCLGQRDYESFGYNHDKVRVEINSPEILKKELKNTKTGLICVSGYQPAEKIYRVIRKSLNILNSRRFPVHLITRSDMVLDDLDTLTKINKDSWLSVSFSLSNFDNKITRIFEPNAPSPKERFKAMGEIGKAGIQTGIILSPVIPYITDSEKQLKNIIEEAANQNAKYIVPQVLKLEDNIRARVIQKIKEHYPKLLIKYKKLYELGPTADVRYTRQLFRKIYRLLDEYDISNTVPHFHRKEGKKQVNLENFFKK